MPPLMTQTYKSPERMKMIGIVLKEKEPRMYENLKRDGDLQDYLKGLDDLLMEMYDEATSEIVFDLDRSKDRPEDPIKYAQKLEMMWATAWEKILHDFLQRV